MKFLSSNAVPQIFEPFQTSWGGSWNAGLQVKNDVASALATKQQVLPYQVFLRRVEKLGPHKAMSVGFPPQRFVYIRAGTKWTVVDYDGNKKHGLLCPDIAEPSMRSYKGLGISERSGGRWLSNPLRFI